MQHAAAVHLQTQQELLCAVRSLGTERAQAAAERARGKSLRRLVAAKKHKIKRQALKAAAEINALKAHLRMQHRLATERARDKSLLSTIDRIVLIFLFMASVF